MKSLLALFALTISIQAHADIHSDVALLRTIAPKGSDVAKVQQAILNGSSPRDAIAFAEGTYVIRDFNKDGIRDALAIFEGNPSLQDSNGKSCAKQDWQTGCYVMNGDRVLQFWTGKVGGGFKLVSENRTIVLRADEGGVFGEPLEGLSLNKNGTVSLNFYGGSAWRWGYMYTFQFRSSDFYLIGTDSYAGWSGDGRYENLSTNLITGKQIRSWAENEDSPDRTKITRVPVKPLVSLAHASAAEEEPSVIDDL